MYPHHPSRLWLFPGELMFSVQQDPRAPANHWHCTLISEPVEGALTFSPDKVPASMVCTLRSSFYLFPWLVLLYGELLFIATPPLLLDSATNDAAQLNLWHSWTFSPHSSGSVLYHTVRNIRFDSFCQIVKWSSHIISPALSDHCPPVN